MIVLFFFVGCGDTPIFKEMDTNRLKVKIKGTFETDGDSNFITMVGQDPKAAPIEDTNSVDDVQLTAGTNDTLPTTLMFDIAEVRLNGKKFSNYRKVIEASLTGDDTFFNGSGIELENDDPGNGHYDTVQVYIRKMILDNAMIYQSVGSSLTYEEPATVIFHEATRQGFDFNQLQVNSYWDSLRTEASTILRNFPVEIPITGGLDYDSENEETVLEIRFVIKNFIKKYEYDYYDEGVFKVCHYFAPSDWLRDIRAGENDIGRNLHAVARAYVPGKTGSVTVTGVASGYYVIAIPESEPITDYFITDTGVNLRNAVNTTTNCDLPQSPSYPGAYIEAVLDYYLKYEDYKYDWNIAVSTCGTLTTYESKWDTYEAAVKNFKIAPYVAYSGSGTTVKFNNMAPGKYKFYTVAQPAYGSLFSGASPFTAHNSGTAETITTGTQTIAF